LNKKQKRRRQKQARHQSHATMPANSIEIADQEGNQVKASETHKPKNASNSHKQPSWPKRCGEWARRNHGPVIAAFTIVLAIVAFIQALIYWKQLDIIRKDQRPWVKVDSPAVVPSPSIDSPELIPPVTIVNAGKTPARPIFSEFFVERLNAENQPTFTGRKVGGFTTGVMYPNVPVTLQPGVISYRITQSDLPPYEDGKIYFAFYGNVTYSDEFGTPHWSHYCVFMSHTPPVGTIRNFNASNCTSYNDTDTN
jgi:hypothetical protein